MPKTPDERTYRHYFNKQVLGGHPLTPEEMKLYADAARALGQEVYVLGDQFAAPTPASQLVS